MLFSPEGVSMNSQIPRSAITFASVSTLLLLAVWVFAVPAVVSLSTFAFLAVIVLGGAGIALMTWRNGRSDESVSQILNTVETSPAHAKPAIASRTK
jgi:hypothetical protein